MNRKLSFLISLALVIVCFVGSAWAVGLGGPAYSVAPLTGDKVVYTTSENFSTGTLGVIDTDSGIVSTGKVTNLGGDAVVFSFSASGEERIFLANRLNWGASTEVTVYDPFDWSVKWNGTLTGNVHGVAANSNGLYIAYYGSGAGLGWIEKRSLDDYSSVILSRDIIPVVSEDKLESIMSAEDGGLYALIQGFEGYPASCDKGAVYKLDKDLTTVMSTDVGTNPKSISLFGNELYVAFDGSYNSAEDGLQVIDITDFSKVDVSVSGFKDTNEYISGAYLAGSYSGFLVTSVMDSTTYETLNKIYLIGDSDINLSGPSITLPTPSVEMKGYLGTVALDNKGMIWACAGDGASGSLAGVAKDGSKIVKYTSEESTSSSGGGCSVGFAPAALLLFAPILLFSKGR